MTNHKQSGISGVADEILASILATPKKQRRLLSKTFWDKFGFKARTKDRVGAVRTALAERHIRIVSPQSDRFGTEESEDWIVLTFDEEPEQKAAQAGTAASVPPPPMPPDTWFEAMTARVFESEREVEYYFVLPLLEALGYREDDIAAGISVEMFEGVR